MAVSCEKCERQYDAALFKDGRTISCSCGTRVGFQHKLNFKFSTSEIKFFADVNVARLARWLRALGIDTTWEDAIADAELVRRAITENRYVLTLDKKMAREWCADNIFILQSDKTPAQFEQTVRHFKLRLPIEFFTRCLICNTVLIEASTKEIRAAVPARIRERQEKFRYCPHCRKVYWEGSHTERMRAEIVEIFNC